MNSSYDEEKFSSDLAECADLLSPDLVQVLTQPMTPEKERIDTENREEKEKSDANNEPDYDLEDDENSGEDFEEDMAEKAQKLCDFVKGQRNENTNRKTSQVCE